MAHCGRRPNEQLHCCSCWVFMQPGRTHAEITRINMQCTRLSVWVFKWVNVYNFLVCSNFIDIAIWECVSNTLHLRSNVHFASTNCIWRLLLLPLSLNFSFIAHNFRASVITLGRRCSLFIQYETAPAPTRVQAGITVELIAFYNFFLCPSVYLLPIHIACFAAWSHYIQILLLISALYVPDTFTPLRR